MQICAGQNSRRGCGSPHPLGSLSDDLILNVLQHVPGQHDIGTANFCRRELAGTNHVQHRFGVDLHQVRCAMDIYCAHN